MSTTKESAAQPAAKQESPVSAEPILRPFENLGRRLGNASMRALLQAKLTVSNPNDVYEQEADRVADQVMRTPTPALVQRRCAKCEDEMHRAADAPAGIQTVDDATEQSVRGLPGRGAPLPNSVRSFMESRFDADFSDVRIHTDAHAHGLARAVEAQAFTVGRDVVFGAGHYAPDTEHGKRLLAHELTHVVQQTGAGARPTLARQVDLLVHERKPTVDDWLRRTRDFRQLEILDLQEGIDLLSQHQSFQNRSTADDFAIEQTLASLRAELNRREKEAGRKGSHRHKSRKSTTPPPAKHPRVLTEKGCVYAGPEEQRSEYNLIMKWLARGDLPAKDRKVLARERQFLEPFLLADRQRLAAERHATKVQTALAPAAGDDAVALLSMARTIEGIGKDPKVPDIRYIHYRGERYAIGAAQAQSLRTKLSTELKRVVNRIESNAGVECERYDLQVKVNRENRFAAFWSGLVGGAKDPGGEISATYVAVMAVYRQAHASLAAGQLVQAASRVPKLEQLTQELRAMSRGFQDDYLKGADRLKTGLEFTRDAAFAVAGSIGAVVAAPFIAGVVGGLGVTSTAGAAGLTILGTSGMVGGSMAIVRGSTAALGTALTGANLHDVARAAGGEALRGLREGVISGAGGAATRALAPLLGVGANAGMQFVRRAAGEAIVNGTTTMIDVLWQGGSIKDAALAGARSAVLSVPGSAVGGLNSRAAKFLLAPMTSGATAYAGAILAGESVEVALARAGTAIATSLSMSAATHGGARDAALQQRGRRVGARVKQFFKGDSKGEDQNTRQPPRALPGSGPSQQLLLPRNPPVESPEWLFNRLENAVEPGLPQSSRVPHPSHPADGEFRAGMTRADHAYDAYNEALRVSGGREVGIWYHEGTGEYRVHIGIETRVHGPDSPGPWVALVHYHPNPAGALTFRLPAPADFNGLYGPHARNRNQLVREFVEYDMPGVGRGRTEYGIDPAHPREPFYVRIHRPDGTVDAPLRFADRDAYQAYWSQRSVFVEKGTQQHAEMLHDARVALEGNDDDWGGPSRSMAGIGGGTKETAAKKPPYGYHDDRGEPAAMERLRQRAEQRRLPAADAELADPHEIGIENLPADAGPDLAPEASVHRDPGTGEARPVPPDTQPPAEMVFPEPGQRPPAPVDTGDRVEMPALNDAGLPYDWDHIPTDPGLDPP